MIRKIDRMRVRFKINWSDVLKVLIFSHKMNIIHMYFRRFEKSALQLLKSIFTMLLSF